MNSSYELSKEIQIYVFTGVTTLMHFLILSKEMTYNNIPIATSTPRACMASYINSL